MTEVQKVVTQKKRNRESNSLFFFRVLFQRYSIKNVFLDNLYYKIKKSLKQAKNSK